ncbi:protein TRI1-like [Alnus glutinosa]|uniref:protein TRI1-like n=1 Tax=Alnus glutinosa TaxID=3517 RepID=UPI002D78BB4B|nr:protein TRI1-like [Alnus glutinosa]
MAAAAAAASRWRAVFGGTRTLMAAAKASSASSSSAPTKRASTKKPKSTSTRPTGIQKVVQVSPQLSSFLGASYSSRPQAVKLVWEYIKLHDLQNPENKREVFCDENLKSIFSGKDRVGFQEITRLLSSHFVKSG